MRPIKLLLTAFGPYKDREEIDFTELGEHNLFVISGKTGSGKTTIFDGISFALYGSASGEDRDNVLMLRSQFADDDLHTSVEFVFELKDRRYRVLRQIGHIKEGNKTKTGEKYEFYELTNNGEVPRVDRQIISEINKKIEELIGLTQEQFKQIVMLPQGEFRKFLTSETENKEMILRRLFKTEPYQEIEQKLKEKQDKLKEVFNKDKQQLDSLTKNIVATIPKRFESSILQLLQEESYNTHQILRGLHTESQFYSEEIKQNDQAHKDIQKKYDAQHNKFSEAKFINEQFKLRAAKVEEKQKIELKKDEHLTNEKALEKAERASRLTPYETQLIDTEQELNLKQKSLKETKELNKENERKLIEAEKAYKKAKETEPEREEITKAIDALNRYVPIVKEVENLKNNLKYEEKNIEVNETKLKEITQTNNENEKLLEKIIEDIEKTADLMQGLPQKEQLKLNLQEDWKKLHKYEESLIRLKAIKNEFEKNEEIYKKVSDDYEEAEKRWLNNEAAVLAKNLHDGEACQVCGSTTHPQKAVQEKGVLSEAELKKLKKSRDEYQLTTQKLRYQIDYENNEILETKKALQDAGYHAEIVSKDKSYIEEKGKKLAEEIKELKEKQTNQRKLIKTRNELREEIKQEKENIKAISQKTEAKHIQFTEMKAAYNTKLNSIPKEYQSLPIIKEELNRLKELKIKLDSEWAIVEKTLKSSEAAHLTSTTNLKQLTNQVNDIQIKHSKAKNTFNQILNESEFASMLDYQTAKLTKEQHKELKLTVMTYKDSMTELSNELKRLDGVLKDKTEVNLEKLEINVTELKKSTQDSYDSLIHSKRVFEDIKNLTIYIKEVNKTLQENEEALSVLTDMYDVTRGHNTMKISFERFLQIEYLEQIIHAANVRLIELSNGQFNLILSKRQETHGRQSGLALDVNDAYTGQTRDVKTLSGGEKFNASLALALGMSDVIQSFEGNISIEMMFIDEGFGSLDEESLTKSIDALIDLQKSGRIVGVISHVEELKSVFPAILAVEKTKEGHSKTEFIVM